ncbi:MAG: transketolase [Bacillota bacterium]|nr:transketolase [Bacillota bacterium]
MNNIDELTVNTLRFLSVEAVDKAKSGHPGLPMGAAPMAYTLWSRHLRHNPTNPKWLDRDRFILSAGHGSALLYSLLHLFGYNITMDDLMNFRQWGSKTPGHPEYGHTEGVEITTGPLGQGIANGVGMAMAEAYLAKKFNTPLYPIIDHYTYILAGDGCMMEGVSLEAVSLAGTLGLGKLIILYDSNNISIEGDTDITFREDVAKRFESCGWQVLKVEDGNDVEKIDTAINNAKGEQNKPSLIIIKTIIGYGCPEKQGTASVHGSPLGKDSIKAAKEFFKWDFHEDFHVSKDVRSHMEKIKKKLISKEEKWNRIMEDYKKSFPNLYRELEDWLNDKLPIDLLNSQEFWDFHKPMATREASGIIINKLSELVPNIIGGSADLSPSTKTYMKDRGDFSKEHREGANLHFGIREHAMAAIANGIAVHGGLRIFVSTFFVFSDYMKAAIRMSALMKLPVIYILTHDSIGVGEDGPTHEPIEQLASLRSIPNLTVIRPADGKETAAAWYYALTRENGPTAIVLSRQQLPLYQESGKEALKGAYILKDSEKTNPDVLLIATGSEVELIYKAYDEIKSEGIDSRIISMPSFEIFEAQEDEYKEKILPKNITKRIAVEAASSFGWHKYTGFEGKIISIDHFGASAPAEVLFEKFGFIVENVVNHAKNLVK